MKHWAARLYDHRVSFGLAILLTTVFLAWEIRELKIATNFKDLHPKNHPYTQLFETYPSFSSPLTVSLVVRVKSGSIYEPRTLEKIQEASRLADLIPGVDHDQMLSIASRGVKHLQLTVDGLRGENLLTGVVPTNPDEIQRLRDKVRSTAGVMGNLVSRQEDAALVQATFIERLADYQVIFDSVIRIIAKLSDERHELLAAGYPMLAGWVYFYSGQMLLLFALTAVGMILLLLVHMRNLAGVVAPIVVSIATAIWGFGCAALLNIAIDPLTMVLPVLLIARSFSHSVQACERYFETYAATRSQREACVGSLVSLFPPGALGVITDAAGLFLIGVAPIPVIEKVGLLCGFWALSLIPASVLCTPVVLSFLPVPRSARVAARAGQRLSLERNDRVLQILAGAIDRLLILIGQSAQGKAAWVTVGVVSAVLIWAGYTATQLQIGDHHPGTSLLWPSSPYNMAVQRINERFAGFDSIGVVVESHHPEGIRGAEALSLMQHFQRHMERDPEVGGTFSFADLVPQVNQVIHGGLPKWRVIPEDSLDASLLAELAMTGSNLANFDRYVSTDFSAANITVWYKDHRRETIERARRRAEAFLADESNSGNEGLKLRLASGTMGHLGAIDDTVIGSAARILLLVSATMFVTCAVAYKSFVAALLLLVPINLSNLLGSAVMSKMGIGLDINTLPVAAVGIGVGINYAIYLLSRVCEECRHEKNLDEAISTAINTTGRVILFTGTALLIAVAPWYLLSELRFQADMGLLIAILMVINMVASLVVLPLLLFIVRPKFVLRGTDDEQK